MGESNEVDGLAHKHSFETSYKYDNYHHWHVATCEHIDEVGSLAPHSFENYICNECNAPQICSVGDKIFDFTVDTYKSSYKEGTFSTVNARGKVLVITFWSQVLGPCLDELPYIEALVEDEQYKDDVVVLAIHANGDNENVQTFIDRDIADYGKLSWSDWNIIFGQDIGKESYHGTYYKLLGGVVGQNIGTYPRTIVIDAEGYITFASNGRTVQDNMNVLTHAIEEALSK